MHPKMGYRLCKFFENCARATPLWGIYIPHFDQISLKISVLWSYTLIVAPMGVKFGMVPSSMPNFSPWCNVVQHVAPAGRKTSKSASE